MVRVAVPVELPAPPESLRTLALRFNAINHGVSGVTVMCSVCRTRGRVNSKLIHKGQKFICGRCAVAS